LRYQGLVAGLAGRASEAEALLREGARDNRAAGAVGWALRCELDRAALLEAADPPSARPLRESVARDAEARGLGGLLAEARTALRAHALSAPGARPPAGPSFCRHGDRWAIDYGGARLRLRDRKGLRYLAQLLAQEGNDVSVLELAASEGERGDGDGERRGPERRASTTAAGREPALDPALRASIARRLEDLDADLEAETWNDLGRAAQIRLAREALAQELAGAVGRAGHERSDTPAERARQSVTKAIKGAIRLIAAEHPELGRHLDSTIHTGLLCRYEPDPFRPREWRVER
jgi:hypothetical protein